MTGASGVVTGRILLAEGWRRALIAVTAGALAALSQAPVHFFPVLALSFPVLVLLIDGIAGTARRPWLAAFAVGYWFGFGYFLGGLWWIGAAFLVDAENFLWLMPVAVVAMPAGLALFTGVGTLVARLLWRPGLGRILALAVGLSATEYLRGHILTGFPWNAFGYGLGANVALMQGAAVIGLYGLGFLAVLIFAAPVLILSGEVRHRRQALAIGLGFALLWGGGAVRMAFAPQDMLPGVRLKIMQPNLDQSLKWKPEYRREIVADYIGLTLGDDGRGLEGITHVLWPESAFPFLLDRDPVALKAVADMLPDGTVLMTGAVRGEAPGPGETRPHYFNSLLALDSDGIITAVYDKAHLVPFGEYLPLRPLLQWTGIGRFLYPLDDFTAGPGPRTLQIAGLPGISPMICYEAIFPRAVVDQRNRPGLLVNVTNDGWFGATPGPMQHVHQTQMRAIEEGIPVIRSANTGISAIFDGFGRGLGVIPLQKRGTLVSPIPVAISATIFNKYGQLPYYSMLILTALALILRQRW